MWPTLIRLGFTVLTVGEQFIYYLIQKQSRRLPDKQYVIYRVENEGGRTVATFSNAWKAEMLGDPLKDVINPQVYKYYEVKVHPTGELISKMVKYSLKPTLACFETKGLEGDAPIEIIARSNLTFSKAFERLKDEIPKLTVKTSKDGYYTYGITKEGRGRFATIRELNQLGEIYDANKYGTSRANFRDARTNFYRNYYR